MSNGITINTREFQAALREYREYSKRDLATILNTKGFYIARGAVRATHRADKGEIKRKLQEFVGSVRLASKKVRLKADANVTSWHTGAKATAPLMALIINRNRGVAGKRGLYGAKMKRAITAELGRRFRSVAFIAVGFLPAVKDFEPFAERKGKAPARDSAVKQIGKRKGYGTPARADGGDGWRVRALIVNSASARGDHKGALEKFATLGLEFAVSAEVASMKQYIEDKMNETAAKVNGKKR